MVDVLAALIFRRLPFVLHWHSVMHGVIKDHVDLLSLACRDRLPLSRRQEARFISVAFHSSHIFRYTPQRTCRVSAYCSGGQ